MEFKPPRRLGVAVALAVCAFCITLITLLLRSVVQEPPSTLTFARDSLAVLLGLLGLLFAYWGYGCFNLSYRIDRNRLSIRWAFVQQQIPLSQIESLILGTAFSKTPRVRGVKWPGYCVGRGIVEGLGETLFYLTQSSPRNTLYVVTPGLSYALSLREPQAFAQELAARMSLGPMETVPLSALRWPVMVLPFWRDKIVQGLLLCGFLANALLFIIALGAKGQGGIALAALVFLLLDSVLGFIFHSRERAAAYLCLAAGLAVQALLLGALLLS